MTGTPFRPVNARVPLWGHVGGEGDRRWKRKEEGEKNLARPPHLIYGEYGGEWWEREEKKIGEKSRL